MQPDPLIGASRYIEVRNKARFEFVQLSQQTVEKIWNGIGKVRGAIRAEGGTEEDEIDVLRPLYRQRSLLTESPYPYSSVEMGIETTLAHLKTVLAGKSPSSGIYTTTQSVIQLLEKLLSEENPIAPAIKKSIRKDSVLAIKDVRRVVEIRNFLKNQLHLENQVIAIKDLVKLEPTNHVLFLGSPIRLATVFGGSFDVRFLLDPRSTLSTFIMFPFSKMPKVEGLLDGSSIVPSINAGIKFEITTLDKEGEGFTDWDLAGSRLRRVNNSNEVVEKAKFIGLAGHHYVWAEAASGSKCKVLTIAPNGLLDIENLDIGELQENQFIVERTAGSSGSMIDQLADSLGGKKLRKSQLVFKEMLQERVSKPADFVKLEYELQVKAGVQTSNLKRWIYDPRSIAPQSEEDFTKILRYLGKGDLATGMWSDMRKLRALHQRAGSEILQRLKIALTQTDVLPQLKAEGFVLVSVKDCGSIGAFKVEHIAEEVVEVPVSSIDVIQKDEAS